MESVVTPTAETRREGRSTAFGWAAIAASASAVLAWAACCVLPMSLALAGIGFSATAAIAQQRSWLTLAAALVLALGWWFTWRRARACRLNAGCDAPSRLSVGLLTLATILLAIAVAWPSLIEPRLLYLIRATRG